VDLGDLDVELLEVEGLSVVILQEILVSLQLLLLLAVECVYDFGEFFHLDLCLCHYTGRLRESKLEFVLFRVELNQIIQTT